MRKGRFGWVVLGAAVLLAAGVIAGCENPFDPINKSEKIQGLSYVDFSATWDRWDSDPQYDGLTIDMSYFNEFGNGLSFHDKPHKVVIEFWTKRDTLADTTGTTGGLLKLERFGALKSSAKGAAHSPFTPSGLIVQEKLWFTKTVEYSNSDDGIRIPIEAYYRSLPQCTKCETVLTPSTGTTVTTTVTTSTTTTATPDTPDESLSPDCCVQKHFVVVHVFPPQEYPRPELVVAQNDVTIFKPVTEESVPNNK